MQFRNGKWRSPSIDRAARQHKAVKVAPSPKAGYGGPSGAGNWIEMGSSAFAVTSKAPDSVVTYFACKRNIAQDMATLPFRLQRRETVKNRPQRIPLDGDPLDLLLNYAPNKWMNAFKFWETMFFHRSGGNAYAEIVPSNDGRYVRSLWPIHPSRIPNGAQIDRSENLFYEVYMPDGSIVKYPAERMFHLKNTSADGINGLSVAELMQNPLMEANATARFSRYSMQNMARPNLVVTSTENLTDETRRELQEQFQRTYGGPENAGKTLIMDFTQKVEALKINFEELQLIEGKQYTDEEFARGFRMPLRMLQIIRSAQGWSTLSGEEKDYVNSCLSPIAKDTELEIRRKLMPLSTYPLNFEANFEMKGRLKGDMKERGEFLKTLFFMGAITPNEVRAYEDMNPIDDPSMDVPYIQGATIPLNMAGKIALAQATAPKQTTTPNDNKATQELEIIIPTAIEKRLNGAHK